MTDIDVNTLKTIGFGQMVLDRILNVKPGTWPIEPILVAKYTKWQTRRPVDPQPEGDVPDMPHCPYGRVGDMLQVRNSPVILEIKAIGLQRLQTITDDEIKGEGFPAMLYFQEYYDFCYKEKPHFRFVQNPWVWAIEFMRVQ